MNLTPLRTVLADAWPKALLVVGWLILLPSSPAIAQQPSQAQKPAASGEALSRVELENGIIVLLHPVPGAKRVAMESFYPVGFLSEPKGMTQASHLLEHLVCHAATGSHKAGEAMRRLNQLGMANAETLPDLTRYDYIVPAGELDYALSVEAQRLTSLRISAELVKQEAPRCYQEADFVERNPQAGMLKHAFMALNQAWRHGLTRASVKSGLEAFDLDDLRAFHRSTYVPQRLLLVLVGGFDRDHAVRLVRQHLGHLRGPTSTDSRPIDWSGVPKRMTVRWDTTVRAVCIGFPPPTDPDERILLTLWGNLLMQNLMTDAGVKNLSDSVFCTNQMWATGTLPFFIYATAKEGVDVKQLESLLIEKIDSAVHRKSTSMEAMQLRMLASQLSSPPPLTWGVVQQQASMLAKRMGQDEQQVIGMILGNSAIQIGMRAGLLGDDPEARLRTLRNFQPQKLQSALKKHLTEANRFVTLLVPFSDGT